MTQSTKTRVLFLNPHGEALLDYLKHGLAGLDIELQTPPDRERSSLIPLVPDADVLIGWGSDMEILDAAKNMTLFINPGTGVLQHIEHFRTLRKTRDVVLANGHGNSYAVAQHTVALLLSLANKVIPYHRKMQENIQLEGSHNTTYFKDITIGFLGYGAINTKVHRFLSGFDVSFAAYRRSWDNQSNDTPTALRRFSGDGLGEFFEHSDVVINALPSTRETREMVTIAELTALGEKGLFVNVGRGSTVVQEDIYHALKHGVIAGAALEVWWGRSGPKPEVGRHDPYAFPFHDLDNLVMSPHRAADSGGDLGRWDEVIENLKRVHTGRTDYLNSVDIDLEY